MAAVATAERGSWAGWAWGGAGAVGPKFSGGLVMVVIPVVVEIITAKRGAWESWAWGSQGMTARA